MTSLHVICGLPPQSKILATPMQWIAKILLAISITANRGQYFKPLAMFKPRTILPMVCNTASGLR